MDGSTPRRGITGRQALGLVVLALVAIAALGLVFGAWTLWIDLG
jgi:hypothetical protein